MFIQKLDVIRIQFWQHDFVIFGRLMAQKPIQVSYIDTQEPISIDLISYDWNNGHSFIVAQAGEKVLRLDGNVTAGEIINEFSKRGAA